MTPRASLVRIDLGGRAFRYTAGQAVSVGLAAQSVRTPYSIANAPGQARAHGCLELLVGTDARGRHGAHLTPLSPGSVVAVAGPFGRFGLPARVGNRHLLLVAGGTGIAPLRAMMWSALDRAAPALVDVVYSARTSADLAFDAELRRLHRRGWIRYRPTVTRQGPGAWTGRRGRIDAALLGRVLHPDAFCFVCGPDTFVKDIPAMLLDLGVRAARIRREEY